MILILIIWCVIILVMDITNLIRLFIGDDEDDT